MKKKLLAALATGACLMGMAGAADATTLTSSISMDNGYVAYLSTSDTVAGTQFGANNNWYTAYTDSTTLDLGTSYFLHIYGYDQGGLAGFLGQFSLSGTDHKFVNGTTDLLTNTNDWTGNNTGWADPKTSTTNLGTYGVGPWNNQVIGSSIDDSATWIWAGDATNNDAAYFSTKILATNSPVPEPSSLILIGGGLAGLAIWRKRKQR